MSNYEVSTTGGVRHWIFPTAMLTRNGNVSGADIVPGDAVMVNVHDKSAGVLDMSPLYANDLTGTVLAVDGDYAVVDITSRAIYRHAVLGEGANGNTDLDVGMPVYFDWDNYRLVCHDVPPGEADKSPLFGWVVAVDEADAATFPKGSGAVTIVAVMQK